MVLFQLFRPLFGAGRARFPVRPSPPMCSTAVAQVFDAVSSSSWVRTDLETTSTKWVSSGRPGDLHFLWLSTARVWPVYLGTLHRARCGSTSPFTRTTCRQSRRPARRRQLRGAKLLPRWQLCFHAVFFDGSSWDGPAWSISAEMLATLLFRVLGACDLRLPVTRQRRALSAFAAVLPPMLLLLGDSSLYTPVELAGRGSQAFITQTSRGGRASMRVWRVSFSRFAA